MKRRQFGAMLATATFSLGGLGTTAADASAQETAPLEIQDVSVDLGGVTASVSQATFEFQDSTMRLELRGWSMEDTDQSLAIDRTRVAVSDVSAETFAAVRSAMVEAFSGRSVSPLLGLLADGTVPASAPAEVSLGPIQANGGTVADRVVASGTVGDIVPDGTQQLAQEGVSLQGLLGLGSSSWSRLSIQRGTSQLSLNDVMMQREGSSFVISAPGGEAQLSDRTLQLSDVSMNLLPPETIPEEHVAFASEVRQLAAEGSLSSSAVESAAAESGVTVANTTEAARNARFSLSLGEVTEDGEALVSNFQTSGTLAELMAVLQSRL
ncbi:hypothetical protein [Halorussus lipolyticus]|uniref:hypothetical protein n=1 Tax=Halorussus lipolyticus TaxID=3034024 RepID=UPI0023E87C6E|nr:hypothetical protein [Halorussus sp. DT80]